MEGQLKPGQAIVIRNFAENFTVSQNAKIVGPMSWVAIPTKHDGKGFRRLMSHDHGPQIYCAWVLMVQIAAKCPEKGVLADQDGPLTVEDIELKCACPARVLREAIEVLSSKGIAWIDLVDWIGRSSTAIDRDRPQSSALPLHNGTIRDGTKQTGRPAGKVGRQNSEEDSVSRKPDDHDSPEMPCLKPVRDEHLRKTDALAELQRLIERDHEGHLDREEDGLLQLLLAAEHAIAVGRGPAKLFRWIVRNRRWDLCDDGNERARARQRLKEFKGAYVR